MILHGDSKEVLKTLEADSIDALITDPPYGYSFMGKAWDKALPDIEIFRECFRVMKPGAFAFVMSAPRSDVCARMMLLLEDAGFEIGFTPIYWTYASGFPKAMNIGKMVDKRAGAEREVVGINQAEMRAAKREKYEAGDDNKWNLPSGTRNVYDREKTALITKGTSPLEGSYGGFQPKPAVEVVIVAMKPLSEKTYVDQALKNGKGITWLDDARIPVNLENEGNNAKRAGKEENYSGSSGSEMFGASKGNFKQVYSAYTEGRFPANLIVSDDMLNDGRVQKSGKAVRSNPERINNWMPGKEQPILEDRGYADSGSYSRYFDLDAWFAEKIKDLPESVQKTFPFLIVPKAAKGEKNAGLDCVVSITIMDEWDKEARPVQLQVVMDNSRLRATVVSGTQNKDAIAWSMSLFGSEFVDVPFLLNTKSTTLTEISSITPQIISSYLTGLLTSGRIANVRLETENGGSPVNGAGLFNLSVSITNEKTESAHGASPVQANRLYSISVKEGSNIHSTVKPLTLMSYLITLATRPGDTILEPFAGSGTTAVAAKMLGRECIGIEREEEYVRIAEARIAAVPAKLL